MKVNCLLFNEIEAEARRRSGGDGVQIKVAFAVLIEKVQELQLRVDALEGRGQLRDPDQFNNIPLPNKTMLLGNGYADHECNWRVGGK
jgi:hypothetical protein